MKRKRGSKKGHKKGKRSDLAAGNDQPSALVTINTEDTCLDQTDESQHDSEMDNELPSIVADRRSNISSIEPDKPNDSSIGKAGSSRLKVKLKSSRAFEPHGSYSDVQSQSDTDRSNKQAALGLNAAVEREDSAYSDGQTSEMKNNISENLPRKSGCFKIKSSKALGLSSETVQNKNINKLNRVNSPSKLPVERNLVLSDDEKSAHSSLPKNLHKMEVKQSYMDSRYSEKELTAALMVIKKIMKMDAAGPFNVPVDPVALGIPDYFDIIDTPMDFGTICHDLEHGHKYMNSEDVFKDVQFIWDNCYKYNNKGDYIVDLMKRVKKNFMKYWMAAGLYLDNPGGADRTQIEDGLKHGHDRLHSKGKAKNKRRRHGIDLHKSDCLCAVCVVRRRRKEREENSSVIKSQIKTSNANLSREFKIEASSINNNCSEDATSSLDQSLDTDGGNAADAEVVENEEKMATPDQRVTDQPAKQASMEDETEQHFYASGSSEPSQYLQLDNGGMEASNQHHREQELDLGIVTEPGVQGDVVEVHQQDQDEVGNQGDLANASQQQTVAQKLPSQQENRSILSICKSLFPNCACSVWNGPHSLRRRYPISSSLSSSGDGPFHAALAAHLKQ